MLATAVAEVATLPICTLKTKYQNNHAGESVRAVARSMYAHGGIRSFYAASLPSIGAQVLSTSSKWTLYSYLHHEKKLNSPVSGLLSGVLSSLATHPMDFVRVHWQMQKPIATELRTHGFRVLYRGYTKSFSKIALGSVMFFPLTEFFKARCDNIVLASAASAVVSTVVMHPVDYLKVRHIYNQTYNHGFRLHAYYKGLGLNLLRIVPHFVITMSLIHVLNDQKSRRDRPCNTSNNTSHQTNDGFNDAIGTSV